MKFYPLLEHFHAKKYNLKIVFSRIPFCLSLNVLIHTWIILKYWVIFIGFNLKTGYFNNKICCDSSMCRTCYFNEINKIRPRLFFLLCIWRDKYACFVSVVFGVKVTNILCQQPSKPISADRYKESTNFIMVGTYAWARLHKISDKTPAWFHPNVSHFMGDLLSIFERS